MTFARVARALRDPGLHGGAPVEVRETHISLVFLAGDRAYKLKKPLALPFLDYSTRERRRQMCDAELRLNRRLAPSIYLGVRAVVPAGDGFSLGPPDDPAAVEHVVEMRRFADEDTLLARAAAGRVGEAELAEIGTTLAYFHASAPRADGAAFERALHESLDEVAALCREPEREVVSVIRRFAQSFLETHREAVGARAVDGHGDLRAEHVVLESPVQIVDCVEFDDLLRYRDPASDLAFLLMDLEARGHADLADGVRREYERAGGDAGPPELLAFYELERAIVRAKVDLVRAGQVGEPAGLRERAAARIALARRLAWRARGRLVVALCGLSGSGKSYLADAIARVSGLEVLSSDVLRKRLAGVAPDEPADDEHYRPEFSRRTYAELGRRARERLERGRPVLVDATFRGHADRAAFLDRVGCDVAVRCEAPMEVMRARIAGRRPGPSDATVAVLEQQVFEPLRDDFAPRVIDLDTDRPVEQAVLELERRLDP